MGFPHHPQDLNERLRTASPADLVAWLHGSASESGQFEAVRREAVKMDVAALRTALNEIKKTESSAARKQAALHQLFVYGEGDPAGKPPADEVMANSDYQSHYVLLENGGHYPMLSQTEIFCRLVTDFLALQPEESPKDLQLKAEWKRRFR